MTAHDPFHPESITRDLVHKSRERGSCANDSDRNTACDCELDPDILAQVWGGRARMARARLDGRAVVLYKDERVMELGSDGAAHPTVKRRYYIETDPDKILNDVDREALAREERASGNLR